LMDRTLSDAAAGERKRTSQNGSAPFNEIG